MTTVLAGAVQYLHLNVDTSDNTALILGVVLLIILAGDCRILVLHHPS